MTEESPIHVFVYGTLKRGHRNESYMDGATFVAETQTKDATYLMCTFESVSSPGKFTPGVFEIGESHIKGEVYEVSAEILAKLDILEGVGEKYDRKKITLANGMQAYIYLEREGNRQPLAASERITKTNNTYNWV